MRYKFIILFLLIGFVSKAQVYQLMPQYGYSTYRMNFDSTIQIPTFCGVPKLGSNKINKGALAFDSCNNRFYYYNPKTQVWDTIKSADASLFVKYTDTAQMLSAYLRAVDTTNKWVNSVTKLNDSTIQVIKGATTSNITISSVTSATRLITQVWNNTGATILRGSVVYISGRHSSNLPTIALAEGNNEANSYKTFALVDGDIPDNSSGFVIQAGKILGLNLPTSSYTDGDILYLSPTVAGGYTTTKPLAPNHIVKLGSVTRAHPTQGSIEIKIENGWQLDELSDVQIAAVPADSTLLQFSRVDSLWHDVSPLTAIGNRYLKPTDSVSLSNRINLKLNISDTSTMLSPYIRTNTANASYVTSVFRKTASDSVFFVRGGTNNFAFRDSTGGGLTVNSSIINGSSTGAILYTGGSNILRTNTNLAQIDSTNSSFYTSRIRVSSSSNTIPYFSERLDNGNLISFSLTRNAGYATEIRAWDGTSATVPIITLWGRGVRIGNNTANNNNSAYLDVESTTRGFLQPRMTTSQMNAISTPATGLSVFNTTDSSEYVYRGTGGGWQRNWNANNLFFTYGGTNGGFALTNPVVANPGLYTTMLGVGINAGNGNYNTFIGHQAGRVMNAGEANNTAIGSLAMYSMTSGQRNTILGSQAMYNLGAAFDNTMIGYGAGINLSGFQYFNTFLGSSAGATNATNNNTTTSTNGVMIGHNSKTLSTNLSYDEIAIGTSVIGNGARTLTLGNNAINETYLKGVISLGRSTGTRQTMNAGALLDMSSTTHGLLIPKVANTNSVGRSINTVTRSNGTGYTNGNYQNISLTGGTGNYATADLTITSGQVTAATIINAGGGYSVGDTLRAASTQIGAGNGQFYLVVTATNNPPTGLQVFNTTDSSVYTYRGSGAGWQQVANEIVNTGTLDFPSTNAQNSSDLTITLTGAVDGDAVVLGVPNAAVNANSCYTAWVSAANTVTIRLNNYSSGAIDPASATFKVTIIK